MLFAFTTTRFPSADPPNVTVAPVTKPPPETVTEVPPAVDPEVGLIELIVGGGVGPPVLGKIVESFHTAPGAVFR
jgi:hypothetical protein